MPDFRTITARFTAYVPDSADSDMDPDPVPIEGTVRFEPSYARGAIAYATPEFVVPEPIHAQLRDGELVTSVAQGDDIVYQPVRLMVTEDDRAGQSWTWTARFRDVTIQDEPHEISDLTFTVPPGDGPLDLAEVVGTRAGGTITVRGPKGDGITSITRQGNEIVIKWDNHPDVILPVPDPSTWLRVGTGSPQGVVSAPVGAQYIDTAATLGVRRWVKVSGSDSSGWSVADGDTGWRDISGSLTETWEPIPSAIGACRIKRAGDLVTVVLGVRWKGPTVQRSAGQAVLSPTPAGFRSNLFVTRGAARVESFTSSLGASASAANLELMPDVGRTGPWAAGDRLLAEITYRATDGWPSTLPGTPV